MADMSLVMLGVSSIISLVILVIYSITDRKIENIIRTTALTGSSASAFCALVAKRSPNPEVVNIAAIMAMVFLAVAVVSLILMTLPRKNC